MKRLPQLLIGTLSAALLASTAHAATGSNSNSHLPTQPRANATGQATETSLSRADRTFLENASQGSHAEIAASREAQKKSGNPAIQKFAAAMIQDHTAMLDEVKALAATKGYTPPHEPSILQRTELTALSALSGDAFDTMYVDRLGIAAHEATIEQFEQAAQQADDPDIRALAEKSLPKLRHHLDMARSLDQKQKTD